MLNRTPGSGRESFEPDEVALVEEVAGYLGRLIHRTQAPDLEQDEEELRSGTEQGVRHVVLHARLRASAQLTSVGSFSPPKRSSAER